MTDFISSSPFTSKEEINVGELSGKVSSVVIGRAARPRGGRSLGRYPFQARVNAYLENAKNLYSKPTLDELERRFRRMAKDFLTLRQKGKIKSDDPLKMTEEDILAYIGLLKARGMKESGLAHNLGSLRKLLLYYNNPVYDQMKVKHGKMLPRRRTGERYPPIKKEGVKAILKASETAVEWKDVQAFALVILAIHSGLRTKELRLAKVEDLDTNKWNIAVKHPKGEGTWGMERTAPILPPAVPILKRYLQLRREIVMRNYLLHEALFPAINENRDGFLSYGSIEKLKLRVESIVGFDFDLRACRRTFGQSCIDRGVNIEKVSVAMGHSTTKTTEQYYCRTKEEAALQEIQKAWSGPAFNPVEKPRIEKYFPPSGYN